MSSDYIVVYRQSIKHHIHEVDVCKLIIIRKHESSLYILYTIGFIINDIVYYAFSVKELNHEYDYQVFQ